MSTIEINGHAYEIQFDFSVVCEVEELLNAPLNLSDYSRQSVQLAVMYACLKSFNAVPWTFSEFKHTIKPSEYAAAAKAVTDAMLEFYHVPEVAESHVPEETSEEGNEERPNP